MRIGVLALQGAFIEHEKMLQKLGAECIELRQASDLKTPIDGLVLPGGESTVQGKLLRELSMFEPLKEQILQGLPVLGTCAGMILLAETIDGDPIKHFGTIPMTVKRNAYGRQLGSFYTEYEVKGLGTVPMTFIRAPYVKEASKDVEILAEYKNRIVGVQYKNQMAYAFHPELNDDTRIHQKFLDCCRENCKK